MTSPATTTVAVLVSGAVLAAHGDVADGHRVTALEMQVSGRDEVTEYVVENPVSELDVMGAVTEDATEQPD